MAMPDFSPEVEIRPFHVRAMYPVIIIGTDHSLWTRLWDRYHVPQNAFLVMEMKSNCNQGWPYKQQNSRHEHDDGFSINVMCIEMLWTQLKLT